MNNIEALKAERSECNESKSKGMSGCLAINGKVICYFPQGSSFNEWSEKIKNLLEESINE
jgi:hypothetical protein